MRQKKPALVITFSSTTAAIRMEAFCLENNLPGRMIPVPREITAGCGLAWKAPTDAQEQLLQSLTQAGICWEDMRILEL